MPVWIVFVSYSTGRTFYDSVWSTETAAKERIAYLHDQHPYSLSPSYIRDELDIAALRKDLMPCP